MNDYRLRIRLKSTTGTPWQSDTIFGHLCWQVAYGTVGITIDDFLMPFKAGKAPFVISDGFPADLLPMPQLNLKTDINSKEDYEQFKRWKKAEYISFNQFQQIRHGGNKENIRKLWRQDPPFNPITLELIPHAPISRTKFTVGDEPGFYETESKAISWPIDNEKEHDLDVYIRCENDWIDIVKKLFEKLSLTGFGRDKSTGLGVFDIVDFDSFTEFEVTDQANSFISLSTMVPAMDDPIDASYRIRTKYGKLGEGINRNPFKKPLLQIQPGAVFKVNGKVKDFYGCMIEDIAPSDQRVVQNCYCLAVSCNLAN